MCGCNLEQRFGCGGSPPSVLSFLGLISCRKMEFSIVGKSLANPVYVFTCMKFGPIAQNKRLLQSKISPSKC